MALARAAGGPPHSPRSSCASGAARSPCASGAARSSCASGGGRRRGAGVPAAALIALAALLAPAAGAEEVPWAGSMREELVNLLADHGGRLEVYVEDLRRGTTFAVNADRPVYLASSVKLLVLVEVFRQRDAGALSLDEGLYYGRKDIRDGAPAMNRKRVGKRYKVRDLVTYMIRDSDNAATDLLMKRVGLDNIERGLTRDGIGGVGPLVRMVHLRRSVYRALDPRADHLDAVELRDVLWRDHHHPRLDLLKKHIGKPWGDYDLADLDAAYDAYYETGVNHASMRAMGTVLGRIVRGTMVSRRASADMLRELEHVWSSGNRIDGVIPAGTRLAHKTGTQRRRIVDAAVVWLKDGTPLVMCIAVQGLKQDDAEALLRAVATRIFERAG